MAAKKEVNLEIPAFSMADLVKEIKKVGDGRYAFMNPASQMKMGDIIPFFYHTLNLITYGGFPYGGIHEFFGHSQTGKCLTGDTIINDEAGRCIKLEELMMSDDASVPLPPHTLLEDDTWYRLKQTKNIINGSGRAEAASRFYFGGKKKVTSLLLENFMTITGTPEHHLTMIVDGAEQDLTIEEIQKLVDKGTTVYAQVPVYHIPEKVRTSKKRTLAGPHPMYEKESNRISTGFVLGVIGQLLLYDPRMAGELRVVAGLQTQARSTENTHARIIARNYVKNVLSDWNLRQPVTLDDPKFLAWCKEQQALGCSSETIEVPRCVRMAPWRDRFDYFCGVLRTGHVIGTVMHVETKSKAFFQQFYSLCLTLGIVPKTTATSGGGKELYGMFFDPSDNAWVRYALNTIRFDSVELEFLLKRCAQLELEGMVWPEYYSFERADVGSIGEETDDYRVKTFLRVPVIKATELKTLYPVYDLEMPDTHHYIANGIKSHNSYYMYRMAAMSQHMYPDTVVMVLDKENAYNPDRGAQLGLNNDMTLHYPSHTIGMPGDVVLAVKDMQDYLLKRYKTGVPHLLVILDSIAAFKSGANYGKENMGKSAKHWHEAYRELMDVMYTNVMMLVANHVTYNPNVMFGNNETKAQANATNYYRTCGIGLEHGRKIKNENGDIIGEWLLVVVDKTRSGPSFRKAYIPFLFDQSLSKPLDGYLRFLASRGILEPSNKAEYKKFETKTLLYHAPGLDKPIQIMDDQPEEVLARFPQLYYTAYPDFGGGAWAQDQEAAAFSDLQAAFKANADEDSGDLDISSNISQLMTAPVEIPKL